MILEVNVTIEELFEYFWKMGHYFCQGCVGKKLFPTKINDVYMHFKPHILLTVKLTHISL